MYGSVPAYRTLKQGVSDGPDVAELNENLIDLGFDPYGAITDDEAFGEATAAAVRRWQKAEGLTETGEVELGRVVFAPGARRVTAVKVALGQDPPGRSGPQRTGRQRQRATGRAADEAGRETDKAASEHKPPRKHAAEKQDRRRKTAEDARAESSRPSKEPARQRLERTRSGRAQRRRGGRAVLSTTSTQQLVQLKVKAEQQQLARVGEPAPVTLPGGGVVHGHGSSTVGTVASEAQRARRRKSKRRRPSGESGESATIPVTLALDAPRSPTSTRRRSASNWSRASAATCSPVPATALIATAGGGYAIEVARGRPPRRRCR